MLIACLQDATGAQKERYQSQKPTNLSYLSKKIHLFFEKGLEIGNNMWYNVKVENVFGY